MAGKNLIKMAALTLSLSNIMGSEPSQVSQEYQEPEEKDKLQIVNQPNGVQIYDLASKLYKPKKD